MTDREKMSKAEPNPARVAEKLRCYRLKTHPELCTAQDCEYNNNDPAIGYWCCYNRLIHDAEELLKSQEPRLLTLDEVIAHYSLPPVFVDDLGMQEDYCMDIKPLYFDFSNDELTFVEHWRGYDHVRQYLDNWKASYGDKWVCWTDKPTDEQRRAVKWDDG